MLEATIVAADASAGGGRKAVHGRHTVASTHGGGSSSWTRSNRGGIGQATKDARMVRNGGGSLLLLLLVELE